VKETSAWTACHDRYDIDNPHAKQNIVADGVTLRQLLELSSPVDELSREWSGYFKMTLREVYPVLDAHSSDLDDLEEGIVRTFVWLLSKRPDGLIVKKRGFKEAERVRQLAERIVSKQVGGLGTASLIDELDRELRADSNTLNPGTTADLVSAAIFCKLLRITFP
jgi:triphosphoribosyl-dephospho-CoA synthase